MTPMPHSPFILTVEAGPGTASLHLAGDLDYATSDELVQHADHCLTTRPDLHDLRLDCTALRFCDTMGISALLMIHRKTTARDVRLHLDGPPPFLERILNTTGVRQLFHSPAHPSQQADQAPPRKPHLTRTSRLIPGGEARDSALPLRRKRRPRRTEWR